MEKELEKMYVRLNRLTDMVSLLYVDLDKKEEHFKEQINKVSIDLEALKIENELQNVEIDRLRKRCK